MTRKLRILALHGYTSNAFVLQRRLGAIRKACRDVAEFVFVNGPIRVEPITAPSESLDAPSSSSSSQPHYTAANDPHMPLEEQPRAWWRASDEPDGLYKHLDETIDYICAEVEKQGPFDGVFGFSQGACWAAMLASAFEDPTRYKHFQDKLPKSQGPLRFCVAVSGFRPRDPRVQNLFPSGGIQTPILHVLGRADQIVDDERSQTLVAVAAKSRKEYHDSGHVIPSQAPWRTFFRDFFSTFSDGEAGAYEYNDEWAWIKGPSERPRGEAANHSETNSGAATPSRVPEPEDSHGNLEDKKSSL